jgi:hypothetical protein
MSTFLVEYNNKIIGVYEEYDLAETFILSCLQNNLMQGSATIHKFKTNSCYSLDKMEVKLFSSKPVEIIKPAPVIVETPKKVQFMDDSKIMEIAKEKFELQHKINMLKVHKDKVDESKRVYETDLSLYNRFSKMNEPIPDLFIDKYKLFEKLKLENRLSWENFTKEYKKENYYGDYFGINSYEEIFIDNNIEEEIEIESDSETELSEE